MNDMIEHYDEIHSQTAKAVAICESIRTPGSWIPSS
jgi:hypothetical protein